LRFIFKLLIGMIVLIAFLFLFTSEFGGRGGQDISETGVNKPGSLGYDISGPGFAVSIITAGGGIFIAGGIASFFTKNHAWTGAGVLCGIIFSLYMIAVSPIASMFQSYSFGIHIWTIFTFLFGVIAVIAVVEVFTGRSVDD